MRFWALWFLAFSILAPSHQGPFEPREPSGRMTEFIKQIIDPENFKSWGLRSISSADAWKITMGNRDVVVAIIDTGADLSHPDLIENLWVNPGETGLDSEGRDKASNGIDDDGNGYVDDVHGWNFAGGNNDLNDFSGHGTHIAGIIGAAGVNRPGVIGVAPKVSLMVLKSFDPKTPKVNAVKASTEAIRYAVRMNARVINYSAGGSGQNLEEKEAIRKAMEKGILMVAAAGNGSVNLDSSGYYPANYDLSNILSVTAMNETFQILPSSNYGHLSVDLAAPGDRVFSTLPGGKYGFMTGTSQATAFVSGVAALLLSQQSKDLSPADLKRLLIESGDPKKIQVGKTRSGVSLNSFRALSLWREGAMTRSPATAGTLRADLPHEKIASSSSKVHSNILTE